PINQVRDRPYSRRKTCTLPAGPAIASHHKSAKPRLVNTTVTCRGRLDRLSGHTEPARTRPSILACGSLYKREARSAEVWPDAGPSPSTSVAREALPGPA